MSNQGVSCGSLSIPSIVRDAPATEQRQHREFLFDHLDFVADVLTSEQIHRKRDLPACCPRATPETIARRRRDNEAYPCRYTTVDKPTGSICPGAPCECGDPLCGSDDPLDSVAAVAISNSGKPASHLYFEKQERNIISHLRSEIGIWEEIADLDYTDLRSHLQSSPINSNDTKMVTSILQALLDEVAELKYTDGITLADFSTMQYERYQEVLASLLGISDDEAWWLVLTAFDKPVWPADPKIDSLLCSFGLLTPAEAETARPRHELLEDKITDRLIPVLHRALAGHAWNGGMDACNQDCELKKFLLSHRLRVQESTDPEIAAVDLFAGAGGFSCGIADGGFDVRWAIDNNEHATATYRLNHPKIPHQNIVCDDIREIDAVDMIRSVVGSPDLVVGGPPCQSLSQAGYRSRLAHDEEYSILDDDRTTLYKEYIEIIRELQPRALVMENVEGMVNEVGETEISVIDQVIDDLESIAETSEHGYKFSYELLDLSELGLPQKRERLILIGIRDDIIEEKSEIDSLFSSLCENSSSDRTIRQALAGLPKLLRGEGGRVVAGKQKGRRSDYIHENNIEKDSLLSFNHRAREHPMEKDQKLFEEALEPGDTGWDVKYKKDRKYADLIDYDVGTEENPRFKDKYRMLEWDEPSPTIVAHLAKDANSFVLPDYYKYVSNNEKMADRRRYRGITPREAARLQSFPDSWIFLGPFTSWFRQIGNAVPPMVSRQIGELLYSTLPNTKSGVSIEIRDNQQPAASDD
ncbi:DNA cytosine methyltransferase [Natrialba sp. PRR66]|uniref:DNA cytosine methyltransferase n=1 Tax=Natrialba sp. PRR66 TaxID=3098146 RepID=UPI002B1D3BC9|nr:DNA cytosine methyltransferase [Natrialba sp. PRR66]